MTTASAIYLSSTSDHHLHEANPTTFKRDFHRMLFEICERYELAYQTCSENWIGTLTKGKVTLLIYGFNLGENSGSAHNCCDDKSATSSLLGSQEIPHIEHRLFNSPAKDRSSPGGVWNKISQFATAHDYNIVCKPKIGSEGRDVYHITTQGELEEKIHYMFQKYKDLCLCPFYPVRHEYRVVMLNGNAELLFRKVRPYITGNGNSTILDLLHAYEKNLGKKIPEEDLPQFDYTAIPEDGEIIHLTWKHNLAQKAQSEIIDLPPLETENPRKKQKTNSTVDAIISLAKKAMEAIPGLNFASVDIAELEDGNLIVGEINGTVMMQKLAAQNGQRGYELVKKIYEKVICERFGLEMKKSCPYRKSRLQANRELSPDH